MSAHLGVGGFLTKVPRLTPARVVALLAAMLGAVVALGLGASAASAATFSNTDAIAINTSNDPCTTPVSTAPGTATPYPSEIEVSGLDFLISGVNVTVSGLSHTSPDDVGLLLVSPTGDSTLLMTDSGGFSAVSDINLTFDDEAPGFLPNGPFLSSGTYKPSVGASSVGCEAPGSFPDPAPAGPYGSSLSVFNGSDPTGTWKLYVIDDSGGDSGSIDGWSLTFNSSPTAEDDSYSTNEDTSANIAVLTNDSDVDGDTLSVSSVTQPSRGTVSNNANGTLTYTPAANFNGTDSFSYTASDGNGGTATATVTITVTSANDAPSFTKGDDQTVNMNAGAQSVSGWATNISTGPSDEAAQEVSFETTNDNNALFSVQPSVASNGTLTYTPAPNASGSATVSVTLKDDGGTPGDATDDAESAVQTFTINVTAPATKDECKKGGFRNFGFPDQGTCITAFNENRRG